MTDWIITSFYLLTVLNPVGRITEGSVFDSGGKNVLPALTASTELKDMVCGKVTAVCVCVSLCV